MKNEKIELPDGVLKIKKGYNPNSSSIGTLIFSFPLVIFVISAITALLSTVTKKNDENEKD